MISASEIKRDYLSLAVFSSQKFMQAKWLPSFVNTVVNLSLSWFYWFVMWFLGWYEGLCLIFLVLTKQWELQNFFFRGQLVGTKLESCGWNLFIIGKWVCKPREETSGFAQVYAGSWVLQKALVLNFYVSLSAVMLHLWCVSPHPGAVYHTVVRRLAVANTGKDWSWPCPSPEVALQDTAVKCSSEKTEW